jgi:hypothetical protein
LLTLLIAISIAKQLIIENTLPQPTDLAFHIVFGAAGISGALIENPRYQEFLALLAACALFAYIAFLFQHLH